MEERHIPGARLAIVALLLICVAAVLVAGGVFSDHHTATGDSFRRLSEQLYNPTPRP